MTPLSAALLCALLLDALCGDPRRCHPVSAFGQVAAAAEQRLNNGKRLSGACATLGLCLTPALVIGAILQTLPVFLSWMAAAVVVALCVGRRSLGEHVQAVAVALADGDLVQARWRVGRIVSRDATGMDARAIRSATIESLLENATDAIFASLFWFAVGGFLAGPGGAAGLVIWHRLNNTLDAMWGYHTPRFERFG